MGDIKEKETTPVPEGAVLALDSSIADPPPKLDPPKDKEFVPTPGAFMTPDKFMGILKKMVDSEQISPKQAKQMRQQFGVKQSYFTGTKIDPVKNKEKKAVAQSSRVANRYNGSSKGQKRSHGRGD